MAMDNVAAAEHQREVYDPGFFYSDTPAPVTRSYPVGANADLRAGMPVKLDASGNLAPVAVGDAAIGVLAVDVKTDATTTGAAPVYVVGHFRLQGLVFDAAFTTDADKLAVFGSQAAPMQIFVTKATNDGSGIKL